MAKILLVDDDRELCSEIADILRDEGYTVDVINDGQEALGAVRQEEFDLILLDLKIPGVNGLEVLKEIRKKGATKVFVVTGSSISREDFDGDFFKKSAADLIKQADSILYKPFKVEQLINKVKAAVPTK